MKLSLSLVLRILLAIFLLQTLRFKFTAHPESVYIFSTLGIEPWGRIGTGIVELIASLTLFIVSFRWLGIILSCGTMAGAIGSHLFKLGIDVNGDGGLLFGLALVCFIISLILLFLHRKEIPILKNLIH